MTSFAGGFDSHALSIHFHKVGHVPDTMTLAQLHHVIQAARGWADYHLHQFTYAAVNEALRDR